MQLFALLSIASVAMMVSAAPMPLDIKNQVAKRADGGSAYTGAGGQAIGGNSSEKNGSGGLLSNGDVLGVASNNAGDGGDASSGNAFGGKGSKNGNGGSAYSGVGGIANGGSKGEDNTAGAYHGWGYDGVADNLDALNVASGNAGGGGDASSGNAVGGDASGQYHHYY